MRDKTVADDFQTLACHEPNAPVLLRDADGLVDYDSIPDVIQWFLDYDPRVATIKHPKVEQLFHWKQEQTRLSGEQVFNFDHAADRLAIGIIQAIAYHPSESALHEWIAQLLNTLQQSSKTTERIATVYGLKMDEETSIVKEAEKIPATAEQTEFLIDCWLEALCTAEIRVLGWLYREFYGRPFRPDNF
jgi:hypothetical protein